MPSTLNAFRSGCWLGLAASKSWASGHSTLLNKTLPGRFMIEIREKHLEKRECSGKPRDAASALGLTLHPPPPGTAALRNPHLRLTAPHTPDWQEGGHCARPEWPRDEGCEQRQPLQPLLPGGDLPVTSLLGLLLPRVVL